jgi:hypothetical protein
MSTSCFAISSSIPFVTIPTPFFAVAISISIPCFAISNPILTSFFAISRSIPFFAITIPI